MKAAIVPNLWFNNNAKEAVDYYLAIFPDGRLLATDYYTDQGGEVTGHRQGDIVTLEFELRGTRFIAINAGPEFAFNPSVSFMIRCTNQAEIDWFWDHLSASPADEMCGWLKDRYGLSWQVVPAALEEMLRTGSPEQRRRVTRAFMGMKKMDLAALQAAYANPQESQHE